MATIEENIQTVLAFVNARNTEMIGLFSRILDPDFVDYFLMPVEHGPIHGARDLTLYLMRHEQLYAPVWRVRPYRRKRIRSRLRMELRLSAEPKC